MDLFLFSLPEYWGPKAGSLKKSEVLGILILNRRLLLVCQQASCTFGEVYLHLLLTPRPNVARVFVIWTTVTGAKRNSRSLMLSFSMMKADFIRRESANIFAVTTERLAIFLSSCWWFWTGASFVSAGLVGTIGISCCVKISFSSAMVPFTRWCPISTSGIGHCEFFVSCAVYDWNTLIWGTARRNLGLTRGAGVHSWRLPLNFYIWRSTGASVTSHIDPTNQTWEE